MATELKRPSHHPSWVSNPFPIWPAGGRRGFQFHSTSFTLPSRQVTTGQPSQTWYSLNLTPWTLRTPQISRRREALDTETENNSQNTKITTNSSMMTLPPQHSSRRFEIASSLPRESQKSAWREACLDHPRPQRDLELARGAIDDKTRAQTRPLKAMKLEKLGSRTRRLSICHQKAR